MTTAPDTWPRALDWHARGTCAEPGRKPELWDADRGTKDAREARRLCRALCPVRVKCLTYALQNEGSIPIKYRLGTAGGLDSNERYWLARGLKDRREAPELELTSEQQARARMLQRAGKAGWEIAEDLGVSRRTVERWRAKWKAADEAATPAESQALAA